MTGGQPVALVTGGTHGIGRATVGRLTGAGYRVAFTGTDAAAGTEVQTLFGGSRFQEADARDETALERAAATAIDLGGGALAALVNNAGLASRRSFSDSSIDDVRDLLAVNLESAILLSRLCMGALAKASGAIVNVSSIYGLVGAEGSAIYASSKAALLGLTRSLALEFGASVRINAVCPGQIATRMMDRALGDPELRARVIARIPAGRLGSPDDIAAAISWLVSADAGFVNGAVLTVDGGESAGFREWPAG